MKNQLYLENWMDVSAKLYKEGFTSFYKMSMEDQYVEMHKNASLELGYMLGMSEAGTDDAFGPAHTCGLLEHLMLGKSKVYKIADKFGSHLDRTSLSLPTSILPYRENKYYLIEFPHRFHDELSGDYHHNVIVFMGVKAVMHPHGFPEEFIMSLNDCKRGLVFVFPDYDKNGVGTGKQTFIRMDPTAASSIEEIMDKHIRNDLNSNLHLKKLIEFTLKCLLYIESGDPDLQDATRKPLLTANPKKIRRHLKHECMVNMVNVGYGLHKRHTQEGEGDVVGHYRWQPHGPGKTQVKLIWIDEHVRQYGKG